MQLRNRTNNKSYNANGSLAKNKATMYQAEKQLDIAEFNQQLHEIIVASKLPADMHESFEKLLSTQKAPSLTLKLERSKKFLAVCGEGAPLLQTAQEDPTFVETINAQAKKIGKKIQDAINEPSFEVELAKAAGGAYAANALSGLFPGASLLLLTLPMFASAATANASAAPRLTSADISVYTGTPSGGLNMCGGNIYCRDGFLAPTNGLKDWIAQLSTTVTAVVSGDGPDLAFLDCISVTKVGNAVKDLYVNATAGGSGGLTCFATSQIIHSTQATAQGTNFPFADCTKFQQRVMPVFNDCVNYSSSVGMWIGVGVASFVGLVLLGVGATFLTMYCCDKCRR